jgi:hypothetical protein
MHCIQLTAGVVPISTMLWTDRFHRPTTHRPPQNCSQGCGLPGHDPVFNLHGAVARSVLPLAAWQRRGWPARTAVRNCGPTRSSVTNARDTLA